MAQTFGLMLQTPENLFHRKQRRTVQVNRSTLFLIQNAAFLRNAATGLLVHGTFNARLAE